MTDLEALAKLAQEATPGPLTLIAYQHGGGRLHRENVLIADFYQETNRDFYAAASPDVVLALVRVALAAKAWGDAMAQKDAAANLSEWSDAETEESVAAHALRAALADLDR